jgi:glycosyltransferase involved in cell wall biosynthesis
MSMGRAVITTDVAGCRSTVVDGLNGVLIEARSVNSLVGAMILLIKDRSLVAEMGRKSRMIAEEKFDVQIVTRSIIDGMGIKISNAKQRSNESYWK